MVYPYNKDIVDVWCRESDQTDYYTKLSTVSLYGCRWMYLHGLEEIGTIFTGMGAWFQIKLRSSLYTLQTRNTCRSFIKKRKESMKRNVGKAINIINACSFHPCTGKKALRVKRSNRLYWSPCVAARSGLALSSIPSVPPHKKVQIYIRSPFIYIFSKKY